MKRTAIVRLTAMSAMALALAGVLPALWSVPADAATTFTVNKTSDAKDRKISDSVCDTSRLRGKQCTLRAAIEESNDTTGADTINFNIVSDASVKTIKPAKPLPEIIEAVTINGYTQPGASENTLAEGNDAILKIQLNGTNAGTGVSGLEIQAAESTIRGLVINRFSNIGVFIANTGATGNKVEGNFIGTNAAGTQALGNSGSGVFINDSSNNTIGGTISAAANRIANNGQDGVVIVELIVEGTGNSILRNSIFSNGDLGIDLATSGVTANDTDDPDTGPNNLQNFPVITSVTQSSTFLNPTRVSGTLNSNPSQDFTVQCFLAGETPEDADPSGHGEGRAFMAEDADVRTDSGGDASFECDFLFPASLEGKRWSATATNEATGDTSEFSANFPTS